jgi:hypothetical protein
MRVHNSDIMVGTTDSRYTEYCCIRSFYGEKVGLGFGLICLRVSAPLCYEHSVSLIIFVVTLFHNGCRDTKIGLFIKFGSLPHRCLNIPLNKGWMLPDAPF